jgi:Protein of unknown function (DUF669)
MATTAKKTRRKGNTDTIDFTGVKSGGATIPDGRYTAKVVASELKEGKESGEPYRQLTWEITSKKCNGREVPYDNYSLQPQALWRLKGMLEAMEIEVPDGEQEIDWDDIIDDETECIIELTAEQSPESDRKYARVTGHAPLSDGNTVDDEAGDEDEPKPGKRKPARDEDEDTPPRRRAKDVDEGDDEPPKRRGKKDEDEGEEEEPPKRAGKVKKGAKVKFKDEKNKLTKGTIESIDGDTATVVTDDEDTYEIDIDELTVIG